MMDDDGVDLEARVGMQFQVPCKHSPKEKAGHRAAGAQGQKDVMQFQWA